MKEWRTRVHNLILPVSIRTLACSTARYRSASACVPSSNVSKSRGTACFERRRSYGDGVPLDDREVLPSGDEEVEVGEGLGEEEGEEAEVEAEAEDGGCDSEGDIDGGFVSYTASSSSLASGTIRPWSSSASRYCDERQAE